MFDRHAWMLVPALLLSGCPPTESASDAAAVDAADVADAMQVDAFGLDGGADATPANDDAGIIDTGTPCDASYVRHCDGVRILYCDTTVHSGACPGTSTCMMHASGVGECIAPGLGFCDLATFTARCDGTSQIYCSAIDATLGIEIASSCPSDSECRVGASGAVCAPAAAAPCDAATFVVGCGTDHRSHDCIDGFERISDGCGPDFVCATVSGATYDCVDPSLTPCTATTFTESCQHGPDTAVLCSLSGFVVHAPCGTTNPSCVTVGTHVGCSYPGAAACTAGAAVACDETDGEYLESCTAEGIPVRMRCIVGTGPFASCACRQLERHPMSFTIECAQTDGTPCATTSY